MKSSILKNLSLKVEKFVPGGEALATLSLPGSPEDGKKVFLLNALPGEIVEELEITKQKSSYLKAVATKIKTPAKNRIVPKDPCFLSTSPWQILSYPSELEEKRALVEESLKEAKIPLSNLEIEPVKTDGKDFFYRNKMEYSLYWDNSDNLIYLAFHARSTHRKIKVASSSLERPEIAERALKIVEELNNAHASARDYQSLLLRANQEGIVSGGLFKKNRPHPVFENLTDKILGVEYSYSPNGFFQINLPVYELALKEIRKEINASSCEKVLDLYSGVGTIGLSVARDRNLTLVESDKNAYRELVNNCKSSPAHPILSKSEDALNFIEPDQIVILDPPRAGCDKKLIDRLLSVLPEKIIYLSCNPSTQARDVAALLLKGNYKITKISPFNFFPRTPHIENLIVLEKLS